jgi:hypothetical protein
VSDSPTCASFRNTDDLFEELEATLCRALVLSDELRSRLGCCPNTTPVEELPDRLAIIGASKPRSK